MSSFKFIKKKQTVSSNNVISQFDMESRSKNHDNFNGAPAQPAQSFNIEPKINNPNSNPPQQKKGFLFIKKKHLGVCIETLYFLTSWETKYTKKFKHKFIKGHINRCQINR